VTFGSPFFQEYTLYHLTHPEQFGLFTGTLVIQASGLVAAMTGIAASSQNSACGAHFSRDCGMRPPDARGNSGRRRRRGRAGCRYCDRVGLVHGHDHQHAAGSAAVSTGFVTYDLAYTQAPDQIATGLIAITLENRDTLEHNIAFESVNGGEPVVAAAPGRTATVTVELQPGSYTYLCTVPGHAESGMQGQLEVTG